MAMIMQPVDRYTSNHLSQEEIDFIRKSVANETFGDLNSVRPGIWDNRDQSERLRATDEEISIGSARALSGFDMLPMEDRKTLIENIQKQISTPAAQPVSSGAPAPQSNGSQTYSPPANQMIGTSSMEGLANGLLPLFNKVSNKRFPRNDNQTAQTDPNQFQSNPNQVHMGGLLNQAPQQAPAPAPARQSLNDQTPRLVDEFMPEFQNRMVPIVEKRPDPLQVMNPGSTTVTDMPRNLKLREQYELANAANNGQRDDIFRTLPSDYQDTARLHDTGQQIKAPIFELDTSGIPDSPFRDRGNAEKFKKQLEDQEQKEPGFIQKMMADPNFFPQMAIAFNTLRLRPDQGLNAAMMKQIETNNATNTANMTANRTAQWFVSQGREDLASAVANGLPMKEAFAEFNRKPDETFRTLNTEEYELLGHDPVKDGRLQVSNTTGKVSTIGSRPPQTNIEIDTGGGGKYQEELGKGFAKSDIELYDSAQKAPQRISQLNATAQAITTGAASLGEEGFQTGPLAGFKQGLDSFLVAFGDRSQSRINRLTDAELIDATLGADVFGAIGELGIGARGLDTPAEREFLRQVLTGTIKTTPAALLYLAHLRQKIQMGVVDKYNQRIENNVYGQLGEDRNMTKIEYADSIFGEGFTNFDDAKRWLEAKKKEYANKKIDESVGPSGSGSFTDDDGTEYDIERVN